MPIIGHMGTQAYRTKHTDPGTRASHANEERRPPRLVAPYAHALCVPSMRSAAGRRADHLPVQLTIVNHGKAAEHLDRCKRAHGK